MNKDHLKNTKISPQIFLIIVSLHISLISYGYFTGFGEKELGGALLKQFELTMLFYIIEFWFGAKSIYHGIKIYRNSRSVLFWIIPIFLILVFSPIVFVIFLQNLSV